jgi:hypothetical protein
LLPTFFPLKFSRNKTFWEYFPNFCKHFLRKVKKENKKKMLFQTWFTGLKFLYFKSRDSIDLITENVTKIKFCHNFLHFQVHRNAGITECRKKVSLALLVLPLVRCISLASAFRHRRQSGTGLIRQCPARPCYGYCWWKKTEGRKSRDTVSLTINAFRKQIFRALTS